MSRDFEHFDKYKYYLRAVQSPDSDVEFFRDTYKTLRGKPAKTLREDFCGTFAISCEWVKLETNHLACGVDLDPEPLEYGRANHLSHLSEEQRGRVRLVERNVLSHELPVSDIIVAVNFSYFIFKTRNRMREYFENCLRTLSDSGILILDCFGGSACHEPNEEEIEHEDFSYFWDQDTFNPITNEAMFHIHFKIKGEPRRDKVFSYDWRLWSLPELRELLLEAGFSKVTTYWEGTDADGEGNGEFTPAEVGEACETWIAYLIAER